ncbi:MAG: inositol monophosphatase family protein [Candidatus Omnitrophica bacterium]|nr:inositol monophosphatase family protein [Candidatus Omnitrophota bacterium]
MEKKFIAAAVSAALRAGRYAKKRKGKIREISYKGAINLVTDVDKACEDMIVSALKKSFPCHTFLSEENYATITPGDYRWVIDPLDGTTNYSRSLPIYAVSIALEYRSRPLLGVVYHPERDELFTAEAGKGAYLNKKRIAVSRTNRLQEAFLVTGFAYNIQTAAKNNIGYFESFLKKTLAVRRLGSAALDLCYVARGCFDGFWEMNLNPWDTAAGALIVTEAGGKISTFDGSGYSPYDKEILATNSKIHAKMIPVLNSKS